MHNSKGDLHRRGRLGLHPGSGNLSHRLLAYHQNPHPTPRPQRVPKRAHFLTRCPTLHQDHRPAARVALSPLSRQHPMPEFTDLVNAWKFKLPTWHFLLLALINVSQSIGILDCTAVNLSYILNTWVSVSSTNRQLTGLVNTLITLLNTYRRDLRWGGREFFSEL